MKGIPKDSEQGDAQIKGKNNNSIVSDTKAIETSKIVKEANNSIAQMDIDLEEDNLLGEENDLSDVICDCVRVRKGH